ncbi:MAG TPA: hypothetical protein VJV97_02960 [Gemmatimonadaceae bacterium]|nr:hypothetical protein [Gemmatimonadaceae bacterium]
MQVARETVASHIPQETTRQFDVALHGAMMNSIESMTELREAVCDCVVSLREGAVGPVQMILAIKACALDSAMRYRPEGDEYPASNVDMLLEHIVRWAIIEYYGSVS